MNHSPNRFQLLCAAALLCVPAAAQAQDQDAQLWTSLSAEVEVAPDLSFTSGVHVRASELREGIYQIQIAGDVAYDAGGAELSVGYSHIPNYERGALVTRENRIRQQVSIPLGRIGGGSLSGRVRLEQRWRDDGEDLKFRLRPALTYSLPVGAGTSIRLGHESFFNLNETDWGPDAGYDRMRNQLSVRRGLGDGVTGEVGYLNQYIFGRDDPDEMDHALTVAIGFTL